MSRRMLQHYFLSLAVFLSLVGCSSLKTSVGKVIAPWGARSSGKQASEGVARLSASAETAGEEMGSRGSRAGLIHPQRALAQVPPFSVSERAETPGRGSAAEPSGVALRETSRAGSRQSLDERSSAASMEPSAELPELTLPAGNNGETLSAEHSGWDKVGGDRVKLINLPNDLPEAPSAADWRDGDYSHVAINETLQDIIRDFGRGQGVSTFVSPTINISVNGSYEPAPAEDFLNRLTAENGLMWFELNGTIYVHRLEEILSRFVSLNHADADGVVEAIRDLGLASEQLPIRVSHGRLMRLQGPDHYLESLESLIASMDLPQPADPEQDRLFIEVYRLKFALASDYSNTSAGNLSGATQSVIPGVATVLRNLIVDRDAQTSSGMASSQVPYARPGLLGKGLIRAGEAENPDRKPILPNFGTQSAEGREQTELSGKPQPTADTYIQAEPRLNAVIIRDTRENLELYREIIAALDVPNGMVQITASIVDVDTRNDLRWAPPGRLSWSESGNATSVDFRVTPSYPQPNLVFNLVSNRDMLSFFAEVQSLEENGLARVQSRPSVVTLSNTPAILSSTETFFVRVAGAYQADLFNVDVGTRLQVVPYLIDEDGEKKIKMLLQINDGKVLDSDVEGVPRVSQSSISTQAVLLENESLLVGGMYRTEFVDNEQLVPKLGRVPIIGNLFRSFERNQREYQRLIVITPRRVDAQDIMPNQNIPYAGALLSGEACPQPGTAVLSTPREPVPATPPADAP